VFGFLTTKTRQGLAARVKQLEEERQEGEELRSQMKEALLGYKRLASPALVELYEELMNFSRATLPESARDIRSAQYRPEDHQIMLREILHRIDVEREAVPHQDYSDISDMLGLTRMTPEELRVHRAEQEALAEYRKHALEFTQWRFEREREQNGGAAGSAIHA
jgi:hypothetical protein